MFILDNMKCTYNAPDYKGRLEGMSEAEYSHPKIGEHARLC